MRTWAWLGGLMTGLAVAGVVAAVSAQSGSKGLTPQDYADIQQLYVRYAWAIDTHEDNGKVWARTFVPDGEFVNVVGKSTTTGHEKLAEMMKGSGKPNAFPTHYTTNIVIEPSPEGARGSAYLSIVGGEAPAKLSVTATGTYKDVLVKTSDGWRFKKRTLYLNGMPPSQVN